MAARTISLVDVRALFHQALAQNKGIKEALRQTVERAVIHGASVLELTGDVSIALGSMGIASTDEMEAAIHERIGGASLTPANFHACMLKMVAGGGIAGYPTAKCLHAHLPFFRKPTPEEMNAAWEKCARTTTLPKP
jgi:hypothetical protein